MFFIIVGLWIVACLATCVIRKIRHGYLIATCPIVAGAGVIAATLMYLFHQNWMATIVLLVALYIAGTILWTINIQNRQEQTASQ